MLESEETLGYKESVEIHKNYRNYATFVKTETCEALIEFKIFTKRLKAELRQSKCQYHSKLFDNLQRDA